MKSSFTLSSQFASCLESLNRRLRATAPQAGSMTEPSGGGHYAGDDAEADGDREPSCDEEDESPGGHERAPPVGSSVTFESKAARLARAGTAQLPVTAKMPTVAVSGVHAQTAPASEQPDTTVA